MIQTGIYQHFKGDNYRLLVNAYDATGEGDPIPVVIYMSTKGLNVWVRTESNWTDMICRGPDCPHIGKPAQRKCLDNKCKQVPRFRFLEAE